MKCSFVFSCPSNFVYYETTAGAREGIKRARSRSPASHRRKGGVSGGPGDFEPRQENAGMAAWHVGVGWVNASIFGQAANFNI